MTFILQAPVPSLTTTTQLPDPKFDDSIALQSTVDVKYAMDGTRRTYVKSTDRGKLSFTFLLTRMKALEVRAFVQSYYRAKLRITTHRGEVWDVYFATNPFDFSGDSRAAGSPGGEMSSVSLVFEGTRVSTVPSGNC